MADENALQTLQSIRERMAKSASQTTAPPVVTEPEKKQEVTEEVEASVEINESIEDAVLERRRSKTRQHSNVNARRS